MVLADQLVQFHLASPQILEDRLAQVDLLIRVVRIDQAAQLGRQAQADLYLLVVPLDLEVQHLQLNQGILGFQCHLAVQEDLEVQVNLEFLLFLDLL